MTGLSPAFDGFQIAFLADFHYGPWIPLEYIRSVVQTVNETAPDLVVLGGDYVDEGGQWAAACIHELASLRGAHGTVGILGNHDHYAGAAPFVRRELERAGIPDLTNRGIVLSRGTQTLPISGVGDLWTDTQKLDVALGSARAPGSVLLLAHNPDYAEIVRDERIGFILSGHTHGGQVVMPVLGTSFASTAYGKKYLSGLCQAPATQVYVTRGIGTTTLPIRLNCPPEISLLTLRVKKPVSESA